MGGATNPGTGANTGTPNSNIGGNPGGTNSHGNSGSVTPSRPGSVSNTNDLGNTTNPGKVGTGNQGGVGGSNDMGSNRNPGDTGSGLTGNVRGANDFGSTGNPGNTDSHTGQGVGGTNDMGSKGKVGGDTSQGTGQGGVAGTNDMGSSGNDGMTLLALCSNTCSCILVIFSKVYMVLSICPYVAAAHCMQQYVRLAALFLYSVLPLSVGLKAYLSILTTVFEKSCITTASLPISRGYSMSL